jgi:hypothetical protein
MKGRRRSFGGMLCVVLAVLLTLRLGIGAFRAYADERERVEAALADVASGWTLVNTARKYAAAALDTSRIGQRGLLSATSRSAATAELARIVSVANADSPLDLTISPGSDSTALGQLRRVALRVRFEASTEQLVQFIAGILGASTLARLDDLNVIASSADDAVAPSSLSVDARLSAWFAESRR